MHSLFETNNVDINIGNVILALSLTFFYVILMIYLVKYAWNNSIVFIVEQEIDFSQAAWLLVLCTVLFKF